MQPTVRRLLEALILLAGLIWVFANASTKSTFTDGRIPAPQKGFLAPDFTLATPKGEKVTLSGLRGKAVLINVWATWCPPCREELPTIQMFYEQYHASGLVVLGINTTNLDSPSVIMPFVNDYGLGFPILLDEVGDVSQKYEIKSLPSSYFINRDGTIAEVVIGGPMSDALLRTNIEEILRSSTK